MESMIVYDGFEITILVNTTIKLFYYMIEEPCICSCGNEHLNIVIDSSEEENEEYFNTEEEAIEGAKQYINDYKQTEFNVN